MNMYEENGDYVFELNQEETDKLFDPFDKYDRGLSMKDWSEGYRYMKLESLQWFERMIGQCGDTWWHKTCDRELLTREIWFLEKKHAMTFKMMFMAI